MTLPSSGTLRMDQIEVEAGFASGQFIWLDQPSIRALANITAPSSRIAFSDFFGKSGFTASGVNDSRSNTHSTSTSCFPSVTPSGGTAPYGFNWVVVSNPQGCSVTNLTSASVTVTNNHSVNSAGSATVTLQCTVNDSAGHSVLVSNIIGEVMWDSGQ